MSHSLLPVCIIHYTCHIHCYVSVSVITRVAFTDTCLCQLLCLTLTFTVICLYRLLYFTCHIHCYLSASVTTLSHATSLYQLLWCICHSQYLNIYISHYVCHIHCYLSVSVTMHVTFTVSSLYQLVHMPHSLLHVCVIYCTLHVTFTVCPSVSVTIQTTFTVCLSV